MKYRNTKKCECAHFYYGPRYLVTDDPYPIYNNDNYCKIGRFDWTWGSVGEYYPCIKCKGFKINRDKVRKRRTEIKEAKKRMSEWNRNYYAAIMEANTQDKDGFFNFELVL